MISSLVRMVTLGFVATLLAVTSPAEPSMRDRLRVFSSVLRLIRDDYVDSVDTHDLIISGIQGMLTSLDAHSDFLDAETYSKMTEEHRGTFFGVGMTIAVQGGRLTVISPIEGTPAARAGILAGDYIVAIDGASTAGITSDRAAELIRGPKGTKVSVTIRREGIDHDLVFELTREEIPISSVPYAFFVRPGIAYIRLARFAKTTAREMDQAHERLLAQGPVKAVILDLRGNSGGLLTSAVEVADRFLDEGKMIVYTAGRVARSNQREVASGGPTWPHYPLVVLVDRGSASASEIVAGAMQDWDRGLVVGRTTFGKGLVQNVYDVQGGNAIKLTTARFYTPSGRSIQRVYGGTRVDYYRRAGEANGDTTGPIAFSQGGRPLRAGGGIVPDVTLPMPRRLTRLEIESQRKGIVFDEASRYLARYPDLRTSFASFEDFEARFELVPGEEDSLKAAFVRAGVAMDGGEWEASRGSLLLALRAEVAGHIWGPAERYRVLAAQDDDLVAAIAHVPTAADLLAGRLSPKKDRRGELDTGTRGS